MSDLVGCWTVPLVDGIYVIEFEHGTASGKRVLRINGKEIFRKDWMFRLVGGERFTIGRYKTLCEVRVEPMPHFTYCYSLFVENMALEKFIEKQSRELKVWKIESGEKMHRITLVKETLQVILDGQEIETEDGFIEDGTEMRFFVGGEAAVLRTAKGSDRKAGVAHRLVVADCEVPQCLHLL